MAINKSVNTFGVSNPDSGIGKVMRWVGELPQRLAIILLFLALWEIAPRLNLVDAMYIPPFSIVISQFIDLLLDGTLMPHIVASLQRAVAGYLIAVVIAIPLGFLVGWYGIVERYLDPFLMTFRQIPILALFPIFILLFGIGENSKILLIAMGVFWSVFMNTVSGVKSVDQLFIKSARSMQTSSVDMFRKVVAPASIPYIFTGLRYASTIALIVLVSAEMIGAQSGLGYISQNWMMMFRIPEMYSAIIALTLIGLASNYLLVGIEKRVSHWKENRDNAI
jgi:ABC-type nitrate/sulfonate/bicarbonate transport system, permease component